MNKHWHTPPSVSLDQGEPIGNGGVALRADNGQALNGSPGLLNVKNPIWGRETWDFGAMIVWRRKLGRKVDFRMQLNIQNLLNQTDPILTNVDTDTSAVYGSANAEVPVYYTLRRPRNFVLSTNFCF